MKKMTALLLVLCMVLSLAACGGQTAPGSAASAASSADAEIAEAVSAQEPTAEAPASQPEPAEAASAAEESVLEESAAEEEPVLRETLSYPLDTTTSFSWYMSYPGIMDNFCEAPFFEYPAWKEWQNRTGVKIDWELTTDIATEAFQLRLASGDPTDVFMSSLATSITVDEMIESGMILELRELIEENMPDYMNFVDSHPDFAESLGTESTEGNWGGLHKYSLHTATTAGLVIRDDWLKKLKMDVPVTYDDLHEVLTAFKSEIGASDPLWINYTGFLPASCLAAGYDNIGCPNGKGFPVYQVDGQVHFGPLEQGFHDYVKMMAGWYQEGLVYRDFMSYTTSDTQPPSDLISNSHCGVYSQTLDSFHQYDESSAEFSLLGISDIRKTEDQSLHFVSAPQTVSNIVLCISSNCEDPETVLQAFNYDFTEDGIRLMNYGVEGESYELDESGTPQLTDAVLHGAFPDVSLALGYYTGTDIMAYCGITDESRNWIFYDEAQMNAAKAWQNEGVDDTAYEFPALCVMNTEETEQYNTYITDINTYIMERVLTWITGGEDIDENWDAFLNTLDSMGVQQIIDAEQSALDRYNENTGA